MPQFFTLVFSEQLTETAELVLTKGGSAGGSGSGGEPQRVEHVQVKGGSTVVGEIIGNSGRGAYRATFRVVASDGHPITGEIAFTVRPAPQPPPRASRPTVEPADNGGITWRLLAFGSVAVVALAAAAVSVTVTGHEGKTDAGHEDPALD